MDCCFETPNLVSIKPLIFIFSRFKRSSIVLERLRTELRAWTLQWLERDLFCEIFNISSFACSCSEIRSCILLRSKQDESNFDEITSSLPCLSQRDSLVCLETASSSSFRFLFRSLLGVRRLSIRFLSAKFWPVTRPYSSLLDCSWLLRIPRLLFAESSSKFKVVLYLSISELYSL